MNQTQKIQKIKNQYYQSLPRSTAGSDSTARNDIRNALNPQIGDVLPTFTLAGCCYGAGTSSAFPPLATPSLGVTSGSAILSWSYGAADETGFNIEKSTDNGVVYSNIFVLASASSRSYTDTNVTASNTYYYRINAYNTYGISSYSNTASITFTNPPAVAPVITNLLSGSAILSWSYALSDEQGFIIQRSPDTASYANLVIISSSLSRSYADITVTTPNTYYYRMNAFNSAGNGPTSATASIQFTSSAPLVSSCKTSIFPAQLFTASLNVSLSYNLV